MADANGQVTSLSERQIFKIFLEEKRQVTQPDGSVVDIPAHTPDEAAQLTREFAAVRKAKQQTGADPRAPNAAELTGQLKAYGLKGDEVTKAVKTHMPARGGMVQLPDAADENASKIQGAISGVTVGFDDELAGVAAAARQAISGRGISDVVAGRGSVGDTYRAARDKRRDIKRTAEESHPDTFMAAEIAGSLPTIGLFGPANTTGQMAALGAKYGGSIGLGKSEADLTRGEFGGAAADTGIGAAAGAVFAPIAQGAIEGVGAVAKGGARLAADAVRRTVGREVQTPVQRTASEMAARVAQNANEPSLIGQGKTVRQISQEAQPLMAEASEAIKKPFLLRQSQIAGDAEAALSESRAFNVPDNVTGRRAMQRAQAEVRQQLFNTTQVAETWARRTAANPELIGRGGVGDGFGKSVDRQIDAMIASRSAATKDGYATFEKMGGGVDYAPIRAKMEDVLQKMGLNRNQMTGLLRKVLVDADKTGAGGGLSLTEANGLRQLMMETMRGKASPFGDRALNVQGHMAREVMGAIDEAFTAAESTASGDAIRLLRTTNKAWREHTQAIEGAVTNAVELVTGLAGSETGETIGARMLRMQPRQIEGLFELAAKGDPSGATVADMGAEMFYESLRRGSLPGVEAAKSGQAMIRPKAALDRLLDDTEVLNAAFKGRPQAKYLLTRTKDLLERVSFTANTRGSTTVPWLADMLRGSGESLAVTGGEAVGGKAGGAIVRTLASVVGSIRNNPEVAVKAVSTPEGIKAFNGALSALLKSDGSVGQEAGRAALEGLRRAGIITGSNAVIPAALNLRHRLFDKDPQAEIDESEAQPQAKPPSIAGEPYP